MDDTSKVIFWAAGGAVLAVAAAWVLTSDSGQAKLSAHVSAALGSGQDQPWPGGEAPVRTGVSVGKWQPYRHGSEGRHRGMLHPRSASPNMTGLQQRGWDWVYCPPSEGDL